MCLSGVIQSYRTAKAKHSEEKFEAVHLPNYPQNESQRMCLVWEEESFIHHVDFPADPCEKQPSE